MKKEIVVLQNEMKKHGLAMYLVPTSDEHQSEYISEYYKFRAYLSGFTGSAGTLLVTETECFLWTDGRYFVQAAKELENSGIVLMRSGEKNVPSIQEYISLNIKKDEVLGFDGALFNVHQGNAFQDCVAKNGGKVRDISLADIVWEKRPAICRRKICDFPFQYTNCTIQEKMSKIRNVMKQYEAEVHIVSTLDDIAWLFNLRGDDIPYNPVFFSYTIISMDRVILFVDIAALDLKARNVLEHAGVEIRAYDTFFEYLSKEIQGKRVLLDENRSSYKLFKTLMHDEASAHTSLEKPSSKLYSKNHLIDQDNPSILLKAIKNEVECNNIRKAHETDGLVMCKFIYWLKEQMKDRNTSNGAEHITECDAADYLDQLRIQAPNCMGLSFDTIAAYGANAAMCHYSPDRKHPVRLKPEGFFLVDCGGQYLGGTTDITRTISLGPLTEQQKKHYTLVLKGHIRLATARFLRGICGANLDILARGPLWQECLDFNHGTGHGVGYYLNVHESPNNIHWNLHRGKRKHTPLVPGMLTSNEPGLYFEGEYGIRLENLILTKPVVHEIKEECINQCKENHAYKMVEDDQFLEFETVTKVPFERDAIIKELLSYDELLWLNAYHKSIYELYGDKLSAEECAWLAKVTAPL